MLTMGGGHYYPPNNQAMPPMATPNPNPQQGGQMPQSGGFGPSRSPYATPPFLPEQSAGGTNTAPGGGQPGGQQASMAQMMAAVFSIISQWGDK